MSDAERRPLGIGAALGAELTFLAERRWPLVGLLCIGSFVVNWLVRPQDGGMLYDIRVDALRQIVAIVWASVIWAGERPSERDHFLAQPVGGARHEIARVIAGAIYLMVANGLMMAGEQLRGLPVSPGTMGPTYIVATLVGPLIQYLLVATVGLASAWPIAWFMVGYSAIAVLATVPAFHLQLAGRILGRNGFNGAVSGVAYGGPPTPPQGVGPQPLKITWIPPQWRTWAPPAAAWLLVGVIALLLVANRRRLADGIGRLVRRGGYAEAGRTA